jgi:predicted DNA-binding protein (UPF0251 family)
MYCHLVRDFQMEATADQFRLETEKVGLLAELKQALAEFKAAWDDNQGLFTQSQAATMLGISRQAVLGLVDRGYLKKVELEQGVYVSGRSIAARLEGHKGKAGRPRVIDSIPTWHEK